MDATTAKRKRPAADIAGDEPAPAAVDEVSDAEVEEFYAILRRMRDARPPARAPAWRPSFSWEDFAPAPPPVAPAPPPPNDERVPQDDPAAAAAPPRSGGLDLNVEPEPDTASTAEAPSPVTPRSARAQA